jgi:excreted virulence factor EspC (type VII ESX diderm)
MSDIHVDPAQLRTHARNVTAAADAVKSGADAADAVAMNGDAFGLLVGFVGGWFQEKEADLALTYRDAVTALRGDAVNLMTSADDYENADRSTAARVADAGTRQGLELPL